MPVPCRLLLALLLFPALAPAQDPHPLPTNEPYTLNQTVRAVVLDLSVTDRKGHPVSGLSASQFHVTEDKTPQRIRFFQAPEAHALPPSAASKQGIQLARAAGDSPLTLFILDHVSTEPEDLIYARKQIEKYLLAQPAQLPSPVAFLILTTTSLRTLCDYTLDRDKVLAAVRNDHEPASWYVTRDRQAGYKATGSGSSGERLAIYVGVLSELATSLNALPVRKNLIWVGPGLPALDQTLSFRADMPDNIRRFLEPLVTRLVRARITVDTVDPQGLLVAPTEVGGVHNTPTSTGIFTAGGDPSRHDLAFEQLAPETGGRIFRMRNEVNTELAESVTDGRDFYTVSYNPSNPRYDGSFRRIHVTTDDPDLIVRTQEGYLAVPPAPPNNTDAAAQSLAFALTSNLHYEGLTTAAALGHEPATPQLHIVVNTSDLHWIDDPADPSRKIASVTLVTATMNKDGKVLHYAITNQHARAAEAATHDSRAEFLIPAPSDPKATSLRIVTRDSNTGHLGSADVPLS